MAQFTVFDKLGEPLKVRFDLQAIQDAEQLLGMGLYRAAQELAGPRFFIMMLWAGVKWDKRELTPNDITKKAQKAIRAKKVTMREIQDFVMRELSKSEALTGFGYEKEEEEGSEATPENPTES